MPLSGAGRHWRHVSARYFSTLFGAIPWEGRAFPNVGAALHAAAQQPVDATSLAVFRIIFGLVGLIIVARFFAYGWIGELYINPSIILPTCASAGSNPGRAGGCTAHFAVLGLLALGIAAGFKYRPCAFLFFLAFTYIELLDKTAYLNHYYWAALISLLMVFLPLNARCR